MALRKTNDQDAADPANTDAAPPDDAPDAPREPFALFFVPDNEGDHVIGIPARDLTADEVSELLTREPAAMRNALTPNARTGRPLYQKTAPTGHRAEVIEQNKQAVTNPPNAPDVPVEGGEA